MIYLTAAKIKASNNTLTYLIFATWRQIPYAEVTSVGWSIFPGLGYVKLRTFLPPWGKLYFVVEERTCLKREPTSAMREILKHTRESRPASHDSASERSSVQSEKGARTTWIGVSVCGMLCGGVIGWRNQPQLLSRAAFSANSQHLRILVKFLAYINHPVWYLGLSVILLLFLSYRRFQGIESLVAAFVMGGMAASLLRLWILG